MPTLLNAHTSALLFTVVLLAVTFYFLLGSVPLLTLKHDNPVDARFIRSFYRTYYRFALVSSSAAALFHGVDGHGALAVGAAAIALLTVHQRIKTLPSMAHLGERIEGQDDQAIRAFRQIHQRAIAINATQLFVVLGSLFWL